MNSIRSLIFQILFIGWTALMILTHVPAIFLDGRHMRRGFRWWGKGSVWLMDKIAGVKLVLRGLENIPENGAYIISSKHQSTLETQALFWMFPEPSVVLKAELTWIPFAGPIVRRAGLVIIDRSGGRDAVRGMIKQAREQIAGGRPLAIYHEGTRRPVGAPPAYKRGVAILYDSLEIPVVPVAVNSGLTWPRQAIFTGKPGNAIVEVLPPIRPGRTRGEFLEHLEDVVETATNRLVEEGR